MFLQITCDDAVDLPVPGQKYTFGVVKAAQARGDFRCWPNAAAERCACISERTTCPPVWLCLARRDAGSREVLMPREKRGGARIRRTLMMAACAAAVPASGVCLEPTAAGSLIAVWAMAAGGFAGCRRYVLVGSPATSWNSTRLQGVSSLLVQARGHRVRAGSEDDRVGMQLIVMRQHTTGAGVVVDSARLHHDERSRAGRCPADPRAAVAARQAL